MIRGEKKRHLDQEAEAGTYRKYGMIPVLTVQGTHQSIALLPAIYRADLRQFGLHAVLYAALRLLPGFRQVVQRQQNDIYGQTHENQAKPP